MRRIRVELTEHSSGSWGWRVTVHSNIPGDLLVRACVLGRNRGTNFLDPADAESTVVESAMYSALHAIDDFYDDIDSHPALYGPDVRGTRVSIPEWVADNDRLHPEPSAVDLYESLDDDTQAPF